MLGSIEQHSSCIWIYKLVKDTQIQNFEKLLQTLSITGRLIIGTHTSSTHIYMYVVNFSQRPLIVTEQRVLG